MANQKPRPKTQREISIEQQVPYDIQRGNPNNAASTNNRGTKISWKGDTVKPFTIGIKDIDEAVLYYLQNNKSNRQQILYWCSYNNEY